MNSICPFALALQRDRGRQDYRPKIGLIAKLLAILMVPALLSPLVGCTHRFRIDPVGAAAMAAPRSLPVSAIGNGLQEPVISAHDCAGNGLAEVIVSRKFRQRVLSVASLGLYDPVTMQWKCAKDTYTTADPF